MYASRTVRRKHVMRETWEYDFAPPAEGEMIVQVLQNRANNLHEVRTTKGEVFLVSMPKKFRRLMWIRHSMYVIISPIDEGKKVKGEIMRILNDVMIEEFAKNNIWPSEFSAALLKTKPCDNNWQGKTYDMPPSDDDSSDDELSADSSEGKSKEQLSEQESEKCSDDNESECSDSDDEESDSEDDCCDNSDEQSDSNEECDCEEQSDSEDDNDNSNCESGNESEDECENESENECENECGNETEDKSKDESIIKRPVCINKSPRD